MVVSNIIPNNWFSEDEIFDWKNNSGTIHFFEALKDSFENGQKMNDLTMLNLPSSKGFAIHPKSFDYPLPFWKKLMYYWKNNLLDEDYILHNRNIRNGEREEQTFRFYLKPSIKLKMLIPINQLYGNILFELKTEMNRAVIFKMQVNQYHDRMYAPAKEIKYLYQRLCY